MANDYTGLLSGSYWSGIEVTAKPVIVTYSFPTTAPGYDATIDDPNLTPTALGSFSAFTLAEQAMARNAIAEWGNNSGLVFIEVDPGQGDINFQKLDFSGTGYDGYGGIAYRPFGDWNFLTSPYFSSDLDSSGDVFMNSDVPLVYGTLLHEIGHALGLKHPTEAWTQWAANPPVTHAVWTLDDPNLTIMSQLPGGSGHLTAIDLQAIQAIYGTNAQDGTQVASWGWNAAKQTLTQTGFAGNDAIRGSSVKDVISGMNGDDRLFGLNGNDTLNGGDGNDTLDGGPGNDKLNGGAGDDVYLISAAGDKVSEAANDGNDTVYSTVSYTLASNVEVLGLLGAAKLNGTGNDLANSMFAGAGIAVLKGLGGDDYIVGGAAKDLLTGGAGADLLYGQGAADQFIFASVAEFATVGIDAIGDFSHAQKDKINLKSIDPDAVTAGDQAFSFVGTAAFTVDARYQLRYVVQGADVVVQIDANHDTVADYQILLYGVGSLVASDFVL